MRRLSSRNGISGNTIWGLVRFLGLGERFCSRRMDRERKRECKVEVICAVKSDEGLVEHV